MAFTLVKFYAPWCGPCRIIGTTVAKAMEELPSVLLSSINIDEDFDTPEKHNVKSVPTLVLFDGEKEIGRLEGAKYRSPQLVEWVKERTSLQ